MRTILKNRKVLIGIGFLITGILIITCSNINFNLVPTHEVRIRNNKPVGPIIKGLVYVQEITMTKDYMNELDLFCATWARTNDNSNRIFLIDQSHKLIYAQTISSKKINDNNFFEIKLNENKWVGKGNKLFLYIFSPDGTIKNNITVWIDSTSAFGNIHMTGNSDNKSDHQVRKTGKRIFGSMIIRTFESEHKYSINKIILYFIIILIFILIVSFRTVNSSIVKININPGTLYLISSLCFGLIFIFLTPPMQVPDEPVHFFRAFQLTEFDFLQFKQTIPNSLKVFSRKSFNDKTVFDNNKDLRSLLEIKLDLSEKIKLWTPWYIVPYVPQALGILTGRLAGEPPLILLYLGRLFNLIFAVTLIYYAIRIIPIFKWGMVLLACMPMTLTLIASNSYDASCISLAFLSIALVLSNRFTDFRRISKNRLISIFIVFILLACCKPVYCCLCFLFLMIPYNKVGSSKKYILIFGALVLSMALTPFMLSALRGMNYGADPLLPIPWYSPWDQIHFISHHFIKFIKTLIRTYFITNGGFYLDSFYGRLGWLNILLPGALKYICISLLLLVAVLPYNTRCNLSLKDKAVMAVVFLSVIVAIETIAYCTWTPLGDKVISGAQGRYFIPVAPLFFLLFSNTFKIQVFPGLITRAQKWTNKQLAGMILNFDFVNYRVLYVTYTKLFICGYIWLSLVITSCVVYNSYY